MEDRKVKDLTEDEMIDAVESLIIDLGGDTGNQIHQGVLSRTKCKIVQYMTSRMAHVEFMEVVRMFGLIPTQQLGKVYKNTAERFSLADFCHFWGVYNTQKEQNRKTIKNTDKFVQSWNSPEMIKAKNKSIETGVFDENIYYTDQELAEHFPTELKKVQEIRAVLKTRGIGRKIL